MKTTDSLEQKVKAYIETYQMLRPKDRVVAGISGGADSVCLLFVLLQLRREWELDLHVVHVNHGIRQEAGRDAEYVRKLCTEHQIPFTLVEADVRAIALTQKRSEEEIGRLVRYEAFEKAADALGDAKIAVAHNANDQAETMLFHLFRGTGLKGLCGIRPVRDRIIRPLLCVERSEIEAYLAERKIPYCTDHTNEEDAYTRNRIRHHILPYACEQISAGCVEHMLQTSSMLLETEDLLEQLTDQACEKILKKNKKICRNFDTYGEIKTYSIQREEFRKLHPVIRRNMIYRALRELSPGGRDISYVHVAAVEALFGKEGNHSADLSGGIRAYSQYETVWLEQKAETVENPESGERQGLQEQQEVGFFLQITGAQLEAGAVSIVLPGGQVLELEVLKGERLLAETAKNVENCQDFPQNRYTKWLDYDKMKGMLTVRTRRTGDYLTIAGPDGELCHKSLKKYLVTEKVPVQERDRLPLLAEDSHILWLIGGRISEYYKVSRNTKHILQVQLRESRGVGEREDCNG